MNKIISFIISENGKRAATPEADKIRAPKNGEVLAIPQSESAPHYYSSSVPRQVLIDKEEYTVRGKKVVFEIKTYSSDVMLVEGQCDIENIFGEEAYELREGLIDECHRIIKRRGGKFEMSEEYSIAIVRDYVGDPEQFFKYSDAIARFLKSETLPLDEKEVEYTLSAQMKYAKDDLVIVDWDGAFVFDPNGEYESIVELLQVANLQLLRYRMLDGDLDKRLREVGRVVREQTGKMTILRNKEVEQAFKGVIMIRSRSIAEFEAIDREIKLIGEWYSARLYELVGRKMRFDAWKVAIKEKLDSLEDVYAIVAENFSMSRLHYLEFIQIVLFFVLQIGWFVILVLEFIFYTR